MPGPAMGDNRGRNTIGQGVLELATDDKGLEKGLDSAEKKAQQFGTRAATAIALIGVAGFGLAMKSAIDFESAFAGVRKTMDGTDAEFAAIEAGLRGMSKEIPVSAVGLAHIAEAAGQLGIQKENLMGFTRAMADMGVATNLTGDEAATMLAQFANITKMDQSNFERLGSTIVALGNSGASTEKDIASFALRLAGAGHQVGMTEQQILGFSSSLASVGIEAEAGGTAFSTVFKMMDTAVATSSEKLGGFAEVSGMTAEQFSEAWKTNAAGAVIAFVQGLGKVKEEGGNAIVTLEELGLDGIRVSDSLLRAGSASDLFAKDQANANKAWTEGTALAKEAEARYATTASQLGIMKNNLIDVGITFGNAFTPALGAATTGLVALTDLFGKLPDGTQQLILLGVTAALVGPKFVMMASNAVNALKNMSAATGASKLAIGGWALAITAAIAGLDILLNKMTGHGLIETLFGDPQTADRMAKATKDWNNLIAAIGPTADKTKTAIDELTEVARTYTRTVEDLSKLGGPSLRLASGDDMKAIQMYEAQVRVLAQAMKDNGASAMDLHNVYMTLPPELQKVFDSTTDVVAIWAVAEKQAALTSTSVETTAERLALLKDGVAAAKPEFHDLTTELGGWGSILEIVGQQTGKTFDDFQGKVPPAITSLEGMSSFLKEKFGPETGGVFDKLMEDTKEAFDNITEAYAGILPGVDESFTAWKKRLDKMAADQLGFGANLEIIWGNIKASGIAVPEAILLSIAKQGPEYAANFAKYFKTDPQAALDALTVGAKIATGATVDEIVLEITHGKTDVSLAVASLLVSPWEENKSEAERAAAATAIAQHEALIGVIEDPTWHSRFSFAAYTVGANIAKGVAAGLDDAPAIGGMKASAQRLINTALEAMQAAGIITSPSKLFKYQVGVPIVKGVAEGIDEGVGDIQLAVLRVVNTAIDTGQKALDVGLPKLLDRTGLTVRGMAPVVADSATGPAFTGKDAAGNLLGVPGSDWVFDTMKGKWTLQQRAPEKSLADQIWDWHTSPDFGTVGGGGEAASKLAPIHVTLEVDGQVLAQKVIDPWLDKQLTTDALAHGVT